MGEKKNKWISIKSAFSFSCLYLTCVSKQIPSRIIDQHHKKVFLILQDKTLEKTLFITEKGIFLMNAAVVKAAIYKLNWSQDDLSDSLSLFYRFLFEKLSGETLINHQTVQKTLCFIMYGVFE